MTDALILSSVILQKATRKPPRHSGSGYLAGSFPDGITKVEGVPASASVRVLLRAPDGEPWDSMVIATTQSAPDGTWIVGNLDPSMRYDVVVRHAGFNDLILSNVTPKT